MQPAEAEDPAWVEVKRHFAAVLELPDSQRQEYLDRVCADHPDWLAEIQSLLESYSQAGTFIDAPAVPQLRPDSLRPDPLIGARVGSFRVLRVLGRGGMGVVYLAERADDQFRRRVALKAVNPDCLDEHTLQRFENERRTLAVLDHPNIIKLLDGGTTDGGVPFLVTDYVEGESIDKYCASRNLPIKERLQLFRQVLGAVHYAHQNLVVHRDLKPSNILVTFDGTPKLLDFGIAKLLRPEYLGGPMGLTRTAMQPFTPEFASPEQIRGQPITTASDIYSLGVILYRLLTGHHPFEEKTGSMLELERAICETDPKPPSTVAGSGEKEQVAAARLLRGDLDKIVLKAMCKEPQRRYASAEHFSEDIRRHLEGWPVMARRQGFAYRASRFAGRHKAACVAGLVFTLAIAASGAVAFREKSLAERRFTDLRSFADFVIGDFDNSLREGPEAARKKLNAEALRYLDGLAKEAGNDLVLRLYLVEGYTREGDVLGNPTNSSFGDMRAAEDSYTKAIGIAQDLTRSNSRDARTHLALARAEIAMADVLWPQGHRDRGMELFRAAIREANAVLAYDRDNKNALTVNRRTWDRMMNLNEDSGDIAEALNCAKQFLKYADSRGDPGLQAYGRERVGKLQLLQGNASDAEPAILSAVNTYEALGYASSKNRGYRHALAQAYKSLGDAQRANGNADAAERSYRRTAADTERLLLEAPHSNVFKIDLGRVYSALIDLLVTRGRAEAHAETIKALGLLRPIAEDPSATNWWPIYYYPWLLVTTPFRDLSDNAMALKIAQKMDKLEPSNAEIMDVMARAYARMGDTVMALSLERAALAKNPVPEVRANIESELSALTASEKPAPAR